MRTAPSVCACYITANEDEALDRSLATMASYDWIKEIVVVHTDVDLLPRAEGKVERVYKNHGSGFDKQPEDGGFDEVGARNHALRLGRDTGCDWLLVVDADEFFLPETFEQIVIADRTRREAIFFECWHFFSPTQYLFFEETVKAPNSRAPRMHDAHMRAIRASSDIHVILNRDEKFRASWPNRTMHCVQTIKDWASLTCIPGMYHIHTHHMYGAKRERFLAGLTANERQIGDLPLRTVQAGVKIFPKSYLDAYEPVEEG